MSARSMRRAHLWLAVWWFCFPLIFLVQPTLQESVLLVLVISIYANFVGHLSSWQAVRVEEQNVLASDQGDRIEANQEALK